MLDWGSVVRYVQKLQITGLFNNVTKVLRPLGVVDHAGTFSGTEELSRCWVPARRHMNDNIAA